MTAELDACMQTLRERDTQLREQTKLREELEAASSKASNSLAALKTKMDKIKHELDERNKQARRWQFHDASAADCPAACPPPKTL